MEKLEINPTEKQYEAWKALQNPKIREIHFGGAAGGGKLAPLDSLVYTPFGPKLMGDICVGDQVSNPDGTIARVIGIYPQGIQDVYRVMFDDDSSCEVGLDHLWMVREARRRRFRKKKVGPDIPKWEILTTKAIIEKVTKGKRILIPLTEAVEFTTSSRNIKTRFPIQPYTLGVLLGDGHIGRGITVTSADKEMIERVAKEGYKYLSAFRRNDRKATSYGYSVSLFADGLESLGLRGARSWEKFIPRRYLHAPLSTRLALVQGLMDTDGYADPRGHASFTTTSFQLASDVQYLCRSIGFKANITKKTPKYSYKGKILQGRDAYTTWIKGNSHKILFSLKRKKDRAYSPFNGGFAFRSRRIVSITFSRRVESQCIKVNHPNGLYLTDDFIVTHNTWLGCESRLVRALAIPGYKSFIGRNELTRLMASCYVTFQKVFSHHKIPKSEWNFNGKYNYIEFRNGSRVDLLDLAYRPSDPMYERLGSLEYTDGWIDEAGEVPFMAVDILQSRIGRHLNKEYGVHPNMLYTYNPNKGWVYRIHKQWQEGTLPKDVFFIKSLYTDNPFTADTYGEQLSRIKDPAMRARLKEGSFDYDNDPSTLIESDAIIDLFTNTSTYSDEKYMVIDVARHGVDKTVIYIFQGLRLYGVYIYQKQGIDVTAEKSRNIAAREQVPYSHCLADEDGIGGGVVDINRGFKGFIANSVPIEKESGEKENYANLKAQCSYTLAEKINSHQIAISVEPQNFHSEIPGLTFEVFKEMLIEELENIKSKNSGKDTKLRVITKEEVKEAIGRSPDFSDTLMMRMRFEFPSQEEKVGVSSYTPKFREYQGNRF